MIPRKMEPEVPPRQTAASEALAPAGTEATASAPRPGRLVSLDAFRGFIMFWIADGKGMVDGLRALGHNRVLDGLVYQLDHSAWEGLRFYDCIWPSFMLMVGLSVPFSFAKRSPTQSYSQMLAHVLKRVAVLFLLGSLRESVSLGSPFLVELSSALQPIGLAYLVAFLLVRKSAWVEAAAGVLLLVGYGLLLALVPAPGNAATHYELNANLVTAFDIQVLGRAHPEGWGTVLSTIPTISTTLLGLLLGRLLMSRRSGVSKLRMLAGIGVAGLALGWLVSQFVPVIMKMWTVSYGILTAAWACLMLAFFYLVIDLLGYRKWSFVFAVAGMNALAWYLSSTVARLPQVVSVFSKAAAPVLGPFETLFGAVLLFAAEWLILYWMYKRKIFLTA